MSNIIKHFTINNSKEVVEILKSAGNEELFEDYIEKAIYADTAQNRKLGRVGQEYHRGKGKKEDVSSTKKKMKVDRENERRNKMAEYEKRMKSEKKWEKDFIETGKLPKEVMNKMVDSISIKSIPVNVIKTAEDAEKIFRNTNSEGTLGKYLTAEADIADTHVTLRMAYNGYIDLRNGAKISLDFDDDGGRISSDSDFDENKLYLKMLDENLDDFCKQIEKKFIDNVKNDKSYKKYFLQINYF